MLLAKLAVAAIVGPVGFVIITTTSTPVAGAAPAPEVEYTYDVVVRRHYELPNGDAVGYGYGICDQVRSGVTYSEVMDTVKGDVVPSDEFAANYLVSYAVGILCPDQIWQLRNSAAGYVPPTA